MTLTFPSTRFLLLAAALVALAALFAPGAQPASADHDAVWSATLTVHAYSDGSFGCDSETLTEATKCSTATRLSDHTFAVGGVNYAVYNLSRYDDHDQLGKVLSINLDNMRTWDALMDYTLLVVISAHPVLDMASGAYDEELKEPV